MDPLARIAPYYKAAAALLIALLTGLVTGLVDGDLDWPEILTALVAMLLAGGAVFTVPNIKPPEPEPPPPPAKKPPVRKKAL